MPFVRISVCDAMPINTRRLVADAVYDAMRATIGIPDGDRFIILSAHPQDELFIDPKFMGMERTGDFVLIHATMRRGRSVETKQAFYAETARLLEERAAIAPDNTMIVINENDAADWSFGRGEAQFVLNQPPATPSR
jgi:4-oxalocrotonate tautomerase